MDINIGSILTKRALNNPKREAFVDLAQGLRLSYPQYNARANQTAHMLLDLDVRQGDRVALLAMNCAEYLEIFFACAKIGAICVPLNWRLVSHELSFILNDNTAETMLFGTEFIGVIDEIRAMGAQGSSLSSWVHIGDPADTPAYAKSLTKLARNASQAEPELAPGGDTPLFIMYTSGTTGHPKGVVHTHKTVLWAMLTIAGSCDYREGDRYLSPMPMFHVGALTPVIQGVYQGITVILMKEFAPSAYWRALAEEKATNSLVVPAMLNFMLQVPEKDAIKLPDLRWTMVGGAPVPVPLLEEFNKLGINLPQVYGLTESGGPGTFLLTEDTQDHVGSAGKAFLHTEIKVVDDDGEEVARGDHGELVIQGGHIMKEYWNRPDATAATLRNGWLYTGDAAMIDEDGFVYIVDRLKDLIISGGENIYPAEVEQALIGHPSITEAAVIGKPDQQWGETPIAIIVSTKPNMDVSEIMTHLTDKLARYKMPSEVYFIDALPRNASGKILKTTLRDQFLSG